MLVDYRLNADNRDRQVSCRAATTAPTGHSQGLALTLYSPTHQEAQGVTLHITTFDVVNEAVSPQRVEFG